MIALAVRFVGGRYHATPWGAHVNEAAVEWPPSPWRLARALVSSWRRTAAELPDELVAELLETLADPPVYYLPPAAAGHSRHYMPLADHRVQVRLSQTMVFDSFLRVDPNQPLGVVWETQISVELREALDRLSHGVTYLGRSESWCDVQVVDDPPGGLQVATVGDESDDDALEVVRLLTPERPVKLSTLELSTAEMQGRGQRRKEPPSSRWIRYGRPKTWNQPVSRQLRRVRPRAAAVVWALDARPLPLLTEIEEVVGAARRALRLRQTEDTGHLRLLAWSADPAARPPRLDRLALWAERGLDGWRLERACGLGPFEVAGLAAPVMPLLLGEGDLRQLGPALAGPGRVWRSLTPVLPWTPFRLRRGEVADEVDINTLFREALPAAGSAVDVISTPGGAVRWLEFRRGWAVGGEVRFAEPVVGPLLARHQPPGFGLFLCVS